MTRLLLPLVCFFGTIPAFSQNYVDLLKIEYAVSKNNNFESGQGASDVREWVIDATVPIVLSEKRALLTGLTFENVQVRPYAGQNEVSVYTLNPKLGLSQTYSDTWSATYMALPKLSSDLKKIGGKDVQFGALALFKYTRSRSLQYKFGAFYNTDLFGPFLVPLAGLYYQHANWEVNLLIPTSADINYLLLNRLKMGVRFHGFIKSFHLNDPYQSMAQYLSKANNEAGLYLGSAWGRIHYTVFFGHSIGRKYRTYAENDRLDLAISAIKLGDDRTQLNTDFNDGWLLKASVLYRFER